MKLEALREASSLPRTAEQRTCHSMSAGGTIRPVRSRQIEAVAKFLPLLDAIAPEEIVRAIRTSEGAIVLGCVDYHPTVREFEKDLLLEWFCAVV